MKLEGVWCQSGKWTDLVFEIESSFQNDGTMVINEKGIDSRGSFDLKGTINHEEMILKKVYSSHTIDFMGYLNTDIWLIHGHWSIRGSQMDKFIVAFPAWCCVGCHKSLAFNQSAACISCKTEDDQLYRLCSDCLHQHNQSHKFLQPSSLFKPKGGFDMHSLMKSAQGFAKFAVASFLTFKTASAVHKALKDGVLTDAECVDIATATLNLIGQGNPIKQAITLANLARPEASWDDDLGGNGGSQDGDLDGNEGSWDGGSGCNGGSWDDNLNGIGGSSHDGLGGIGGYWDDGNVLDGNGGEHVLGPVGQDIVDDVIKGLDILGDIADWLIGVLF
jgi:hypothetical protein